MLLRNVRFSSEAEISNILSFLDVFSFTSHENNSKGTKYMEYNV